MYVEVPESTDLGVQTNTLKFNRLMTYPNVFYDHKENVRAPERILIRNDAPTHCCAMEQKSRR